MEQQEPVNTVRAARIESGMQVLVTKEEFIKFLGSDIAMKVSDEFEMNIKNVGSEWVTTQFRSKNDTSDWNRFADLTELFLSAMRDSIVGRDGFTETTS